MGLLKRLGGMRGLAYLTRDSSGQMTVELAVVTPVMLVMAFIVANLMAYVEACGSFDRIASSVVASYGVSADGEQSAPVSANRIQRAITSELSREKLCEVSVRSEEQGRFRPAGSRFSIGPVLTRYVCSLHYRPWPHSFVIAGMSFQIPHLLTHEISLVVDQFRPGVVI